MTVIVRGIGGTAEEITNVKGVEFFDKVVLIVKANGKDQVMKTARVMEIKA